MSSHEKISSLGVDLKTITFDKPLGGSGVTGVDVIVVRLKADDGCEGLGFSYVIGGGAGALVAGICRQLGERFLLDKPIKPPAEHWTEICRSFNRTGYGPNFLALAAIDVALWDLTAHKQRVPLYVALGGNGSATRIYASGGFSPKAAPQQSAELARQYLDQGYCGVKPRVNAADGDKATLDAVRTSVGSDFMVMADANEKGRTETARTLLTLAADFDLAFVEEPLPADDPIGYRRLKKIERRVPMAAGEHLQGSANFATAVEDGYLAYIQPDLAFAGGLTPSLSVARHAARCGIVVAPHFLPGLFVNMSGAFGGELLLEEFPLIEPLFAGWPQRNSDGLLAPREVPGHGLTLKI
jgi:L-alanine-DL-glutamate epimerase-like enolase superfamily enzyme